MARLTMYIFRWTPKPSKFPFWSHMLNTAGRRPKDRVATRSLSRLFTPHTTRAIERWSRKCEEDSVDFPEALQTSTISVSSSLTFPVFSHMQCLALCFFCDEIFGLVSAPLFIQWVWVSLRMLSLQVYYLFREERGSRDRVRGGGTYICFAGGTKTVTGLRKVNKGLVLASCCPLY
jgi:hypothetical protein